MSEPRIYLAGPMVFYPNAEEIFEVMKSICKGFGLLGCAPTDAQLSLVELEPGRPLYKRIVEADIALMDTCDGAIICLDPFHGTVEMDAGTAFEVGYLHAKGKPMAGWTTERATFGERIRAAAGGMTTATSASAIGATSGTERDDQGMLIHSTELAQHGMVQMPIEIGGGEVYTGDFEEVFKRATENLASRIRSTSVPQASRAKPFKFLRGSA